MDLPWLPLAAINAGPTADWTAALWEHARVCAAGEGYNGVPVDDAKRFEPILRATVEEETAPATKRPLSRDTSNCAESSMFTSIASAL